jgi:hypothetical protein
MIVTLQPRRYGVLFNIYREYFGFEQKNTDFSWKKKSKKNLIFVSYEKKILARGKKHSPPLSQELNGHALSLYGEQA